MFLHAGVFIAIISVFIPSFLGCLLTKNETIFKLKIVVAVVATLIYSIFLWAYFSKQGITDYSLVLMLWPIVIGAVIDVVTYFAVIAHYEHKFQTIIPSILVIAIGLAYFFEGIIF